MYQMRLTFCLRVAYLLSPERAVWLKASDPPSLFKSQRRMKFNYDIIIIQGLNTKFSRPEKKKNTLLLDLDFELKSNNLHHVRNKRQNK